MHQVKLVAFRDRFGPEFQENSDDGGFPIKSERLWAEPVGDDTYRITNIPFFVYGISFGDIVKARSEPSKSEYPVIEEVVSHSEFRTIRIIKNLDAPDDGSFEAMVRQFEEWGCDMETDATTGTVAIAVRKNSYEIASAIVAEAARAGISFADFAS